MWEWPVGRVGMELKFYAPFETDWSLEGPPRLAAQVRIPE